MDRKPSVRFAQAPVEHAVGKAQNPADEAVQRILAEPRPVVPPDAKAFDRMDACTAASLDVSDLQLLFVGV